MFSCRCVGCLYQGNLQLYAMPGDVTGAIASLAHLLLQLSCSFLFAAAGICQDSGCLYQGNLKTNACFAGMALDFKQGLFPVALQRPSQGLYQASPTQCAARVAHHYVCNCVPVHKALLVHLCTRECVQILLLKLQDLQHMQAAGGKGTAAQTKLPLNGCKLVVVLLTVPAAVVRSCPWRHVAV